MNRLLVASACLGVAALVCAPAMRADAWNKRTIITTHEAIQVPDRVLPAGKYVFKLMDSPSNRHIVQIFNGDETRLIANILAIPNERLKPSGKTVLTFWEGPPGQPLVVRAWFYPGDNFGQEFVYPKSVATQLAAVTHAPVPVPPNKPPEIAVVPTPAPPPPPPPPEAPEVAQNTPPAAETPIPPPEELPKTGSPYPLVGLAGLAALAVFFVLRASRPV